MLFNLAFLLLLLQVTFDNVDRLNKRLYFAYCSVLLNQILHYEAKIQKAGQILRSAVDVVLTPPLPLRFEVRSQTHLVYCLPSLLQREEKRVLLEPIGIKIEQMVSRIIDIDLLVE